MKKRLIVGFFAILMALATIQGNELKTMAKINPGTGKAQTWLPSEDEPDSKFSDADRTLKEGKWIHCTGTPTFKIIVKKTGYLFFKGCREYAVYGADQKRMIDWIDMSLDFHTEFLPVKKGIYYLKASESWAYRNENLKYTFFPTKDKKNYTKGKAIRIKKGKEISGTIYTKEKKKTWKRWYKFRLNKNSRIKIWQMGPEPIAYKGNKKISLVHGTMIPKGYTFVSKGKLKRGTYYVLIKGNWNRRDRKNCIGCAYTFRWNYKN